METHTEARRGNFSTTDSHVAWSHGQSDFDRRLKTLELDYQRFERYKCHLLGHEPSTIRQIDQARYCGEFGRDTGDHGMNPPLDASDFGNSMILCTGLCCFLLEKRTISAHNQWS